MHKGVEVGKPTLIGEAGRGNMDFIDISTVYVDFS